MKKPWYSRAFNFLLIVVQFIFGLIYTIVYFASWLITVIGRILLGIGYFGMGQIIKGQNVFKYMFVRAPWDR